jgi:hypothetical protein
VAVEGPYSRWFRKRWGHFKSLFVDGPEWHLTEYAATTRMGRAWYLRDPNCEPQQQRWHARSRAGCGLAATYAKAADSKFRACT